MSKNGMHIIELCATNVSTQFQVQFLVLGGCAMAQKPGNGNDVTFWNTIFGISNYRTTKQMIFLESSDKTEQDRYVLKRKFGFSKFDLFWPEPDLTLG